MHGWKANGPAAPGLLATASRWPTARRRLHAARVRGGAPVVLCRLAPPLAPHLPPAARLPRATAGATLICASRGGRPPLPPLLSARGARPRLTGSIPQGD